MLNFLTCEVKRNGPDNEIDALLENILRNANVLFE
jgi:hypothetical protein